MRSFISRADRQLFNKLNTNPSIVLFPFCLLSATWKLVQHFVPGVIVSVCYSAKVNCLQMRILIVYHSSIFQFNIFHFMFLLFRRALYKVADVNFYVNKGLLLLLLLLLLLTTSSANRSEDSFVLFLSRKPLRYTDFSTGCTVTAVLRSTQSSTFVRRKIEYQPYG